MSGHSSAADTHGRIRVMLTSAADPLAEDGPNVVANLRRSPKTISPMYVYDKRGTALFEQQCGTPEYYLRRVEQGLLRSHAGDILGHCGLVPVVELGSGTADKTRILLAEYAQRGVRCDYFPIDVDTETLFAAARRLVASFPHLTVHCLGTTYRQALQALPACSARRLFLFLGSSLGNMEMLEMDQLLREVFDASARGDHLLLGADLDKDPAMIHGAYNDSAGYGPASTLNMLPHLNRRYGGNFEPAHFAYRSRYNVHKRRNEVCIESLMDQNVTLTTLNFNVSFRRGELIHAEVMWKFQPDELAAVLQRAGFSLVNSWVEPVYQYGLFLFRRGIQCSTADSRAPQ